MRVRILTGLILTGIASVAITLGCSDSETSAGSEVDSGGSDGALDGGAGGGTGSTDGVATSGTAGQGNPCAGKACGDWCPMGACDGQGNCAPVFAEANAAVMRGEETSGAGGETGQSCPDEKPEKGMACPDEGRWCVYVPWGCPPDTEPTSISLCLCGRWIDDGAHCDPM